MNNPYAPPKAEPVLSPPIGRPRSVQAASVTLAASFAIGIVNSLLQEGLPESVVATVALIFVLALVVLVPLSLLWRRNWIRWINTLFLAFGLVLTPWSVARMSVTSDIAVYLTQAVMQAAVLILLFLPSSSRWYRPNNSFKPKPLRGSA